LGLRRVEVLGGGGYDLKDATTAMGRCLFHLQLNLLLETWTVRKEEQSTTQLCAQICARTTQKLLQKLAIKAA